MNIRIIQSLHRGSRYDFQGFLEDLVSCVYVKYSVRSPYIPCRSQRTPWSPCKGKKKCRLCVKITRFFSDVFGSDNKNGGNWLFQGQKEDVPRQWLRKNKDKTPICWSMVEFSEKIVFFCKMNLITFAVFTCLFRDWVRGMWNGLYSLWRWKWKWSRSVLSDS